MLLDDHNFDHACSSQDNIFTCCWLSIKAGVVSVAAAVSFVIVGAIATKFTGYKNAITVTQYSAKRFCTFFSLYKLVISLLIFFSVLVSTIFFAVPRHQCANIRRFLNVTATETV